MQSTQSKEKIVTWLLSRESVIVAIKNTPSSRFDPMDTTTTILRKLRVVVGVENLNLEKSQDNCRKGHDKYEGENPKARSRGHISSPAWPEAAM